MLLQVKKSNKTSSSLIASLPECVAIIDERDTANVVVGESYEFMITGFSKKRNKDELPSAVFVRLVTPEDILITAPALSTSGSMCSTSTWHPEYSMIYPGHNTPVPIVDNVNSEWRGVPNFPTHDIEMWIRKHPRRASYIAIGVNRYADINPRYHRRYDVARCHTVRAEMHEAWLACISDKSLSQVDQFDAIRAKYGIEKVQGLSYYEFKK